MRFRAGILVGFGAGYYLGAMAGRERYEQLNSLLDRLRRSDALELVGDKAKAVVDLGMERARDVVDLRMGNGTGPVLTETQ
ncbi:MAG TPA: hypothetical protein VE990_03860 [Acidimicrobiales bacterium]|nr:hypothetical protein [Acidimicrobiales bacterium]